MPDHKNRTHALLSASGAYRWLECTPSAVLESQFPNEDTEYSLEGTKAHELAEVTLRLALADEDGHPADVDPEMVIALEPYLQFVWQEYYANKATHHDIEMLLEQHLDFSPWVPEGFGTGDVILIYGDTIEVIDLKYGKGVIVDAPGNPQLRLYALGAYYTFGLIYEFAQVKMTIMQPRLDHVSSDEMSVEELLQWGADEVKVKAAIASQGEGEYHPGEWCRFCKARGSCRARMEANMEITKAEFKSLDLISPEEVAEVLAKADQIEAWLKAVKEYATQIISDGGSIPGWKLVEGRSVRKIVNPDALAKKLVAKGYPEAVLYERKLLGLSALEKAVGKKLLNTVAGDTIIKPAGTPTLAPENDKRPALTALGAEFEGINTEDLTANPVLLDELKRLHGITPYDDFTNTSRGDIYVAQHIEDTYRPEEIVRAKKLLGIN